MALSAVILAIETRCTIEDRMPDRNDSEEKSIKCVKWAQISTLYILILGNPAYMRKVVMHSDLR